MASLFSSNSAESHEGAGWPSKARMVIERLRHGGWSGDLGNSPGHRLIAATDNSIYRMEPAAVIYPADAEELSRAVQEAVAAGIALSARGGGTGTNGQSLTHGLVIDTSRHMNRILRFDPQARTVTVEPGVVLDQLNAFLAPHGLHFPPSISTGSRATIGGMFATEACGKGSRRYGRTSDHVLSADVILADGSCGTARRIDREELDREVTPHDRILAVSADLRRILGRESEAIRIWWPQMNRSLTGYNLRDALCADGGFDLVKLLAGSEGTLAVTASLTLRLSPRPRHRCVFALAYTDCILALKDTTIIVEAIDPEAVEFIDDRIVELARRDHLWRRVETVLRPGPDIAGYLFVEIADTEKARFIARSGHAADRLSEIGLAASAIVSVSEIGHVDELWNIRKAAVGLLGKCGDGRSGLAFIEDVAVSPVRLADFVAEFRSLLESEGLDFGMYGHADVGCVHVRPLLDLSRPEHRLLIRSLSDATASLVEKHGGLLWGEHGKGLRSEYLERRIPPPLHALMREVKTLFDPDNLLNPGKIIAPRARGGNAPPEVFRIDSVPLQMRSGAPVGSTLHEHFAPVEACNGNGACFSWDRADLMCPSYKATRDRRNSPKGRSVMLRDWAAQEDGAMPVVPGLEEETKAALDTCLSCGACTGLCPVHVDIPTMRSRFLDRYYRTHSRRPRDRLLAHAESAMIVASKLPCPVRKLAQTKPFRTIARMLGIVDLPAFSRQAFGRWLAQEGIAVLSTRNPALPSRALPGSTVVLLPDTYNVAFDAAVLRAAVILLRRMGFTVTCAPLRPNGKALEVLGYRGRYEHILHETQILHRRLASLGATVVSLEPAISARNARSNDPNAPVPLQDFLLRNRHSLPRAAGSATRYRLFGHCTERACLPASSDTWTAVFAATGLDLREERIGCCGMAGLFGHLKENASLSRNIFDGSWAEALRKAPEEALATGFSCRSQVERFAGERVRHPVEILAAL